MVSAAKGKSRIICGFILGVILLGVIQPEWFFGRLTNYGSDHFHKVNATLDLGDHASSSILIIPIVDEDYQGMNTLKEEYDMVADLIKRCFKLGATGIAIDALYVRGDLLSSQYLINTINDNSSVTMATSFPDKRRQMHSFPYLAGHIFNEGCINLLEDVDGAYRRYDFVSKHQGKFYPSLALASYFSLLGVSFDDVHIDNSIIQWNEINEDAEIVDRQLSIDTKRLQFYRPWHSNSEGCFQSLSLSRIEDLDKENLQNPMTAENPIQGKFIFICYAGNGVGDFGRTSIGSIEPLVTIHATALDNLLKNKFISEIGHNGHILFTILCIFLAWFPFRIKSSVYSGALYFIFISQFFVLSFVLFTYFHILIPVYWGVFILIIFGALNLGFRYYEVAQARNQIKSVFDSYLDSRLLDKLLEDPNRVNLGGELKDVAIFFSDIRGFTSISEGMGAKELVDQLNVYFDSMVKCVKDHNGTMHKYIGDAIMAVWGDVVSDGKEQDAKNALHACLDMRDKLSELQKKWRSEGKNVFKIGMGLGFSNVLVGNIGAESKREFTVIGDGVNFAARLESATKQFHTDLLVSESIKEKVGDEFIFRSVGKLVVKGKRNAGSVFEVLGTLTNKIVFNPDWLDRYEEGFRCYMVGDFIRAKNFFQSALRLNKDDYLTNQYLESSEYLIENPPGEDWDGSLVLSSK
jgi:adenylate cyclase